MTQNEQVREWEYRFDERLAILCGTNEPTVEQRKLALQDADEWQKQYKKQNEL